MENGPIKAVVLRLWVSTALGAGWVTAHELDADRFTFVRPTDAGVQADPKRFLGAIERWGGLAGARKGAAGPRRAAKKR